MPLSGSIATSVSDCGSAGNALGAARMSACARLVDAPDALAAGDEELLLVGGQAAEVVGHGGERNGLVVLDRHDRPLAVLAGFAGDGDENLAAQADR